MPPFAWRLTELLVQAHKWGININPATLRLESVLVVIQALGEGIKGLKHNAWLSLRGVI